MRYIAQAQVERRATYLRRRASIRQQRAEALFNILLDPPDERLIAVLAEHGAFDKAFTHYEEAADDKVTAFFADGTSASADMLVAADGGKSRVRKQLLPESQLTPTGVVAIMGKRALTDTARSLLIPGQLDTATSMLGPQGHAMFVALHDLGSQPAMGAGEIGGDDPSIQAHPGLLTIAATTASGR